MKKKPLTIAVIQLCSTDNYSENFDKVASAVAAASERGIDLIAFPENSLYLKAEGEALDWTRRDSQRVIGSLREMTVEKKIAILLGSYAEMPPKSRKIYNASVFINEAGVVLGRYRKMHLFDATLPDGTKLIESKNVLAGNRLMNVVYRGWNFGLSICYDLRFPELYRRLRARGAEVLVVPAAFTVPTGEAHWETLLRARAIENQCYVIAPAQVGKHSKTRESFGHSMAIDPWGKVIRDLDVNEGAFDVTLDASMVERVRAKMPCERHRRIPV